MEITNQTELLTQELRLRQQPAETLTAWQQWLQHPERFRVRKALFQIHLWVVGNPGQDERDSGMIPNGVPG